MVHQTRTPSKAIPAKHLSPMRNVDSLGGKYATSSSPADSFLRNNNNGSRLTVHSSPSGHHAQAAAFKYNNMVSNDREQFNALHFC
ncbi:uncharacterized protein LOC111081095 [Drosophila obscura]|uniref:uncharacterized protein LOC111081095 n=1 Tax=Drosophila obscura TaxID=7282 RepID=UPI001BB1765D|nr:uncharacterized protein LOC111081095 [Drosophila obscura]